MPIVLDPSAPVLDKEEMTFKKRRRGQLDQIRLTPEQMSTVIYRKMESTNTELTDTVRPLDATLVEQFTDLPQSLKNAGLSPRIFVNKDGEDQPISVDDGMILTFHGTWSSEVGTSVTGQIISKEEAEEAQELTGEEQPTWQLWEYRLAELFITDGPARTERLLDSADEQKKASEAGMMESIQKAFAAIAGSGGPVNMNTMATNPEDAIDGMVEQLANLSEDRRDAVLQMAALKAEDNIEATEPKGATGKPAAKKK